MRIGTAFVLIAIGAMLRFAVSVDADGFNINTVGLSCTRRRTAVSTGRSPRVRPELRGDA